MKQRDGKKTMIVSNSQTIVSSESNFDPTNMIYEDVTVDPEFTKTTAASNAPNSIEYYIEKPKMFKRSTSRLLTKWKFRILIMEVEV